MDREKKGEWEVFSSVNIYPCAKACIALCIENIQKIATTGGSDDAETTTTTNPLTIMDMFVSLFCFLKDSSTASPVLLDDFKVSFDC